MTPGTPSGTLVDSAATEGQTVLWSLDGIHFVRTARGLE